MRYARLAALLLAALLAACGGSGDDKSKGTAGSTATQPAAVAQAIQVSATAATTPAAGAFDYMRLDKYIPPDSDLPDRVSYQAKVDLSNEAAANDPAQLKMFQDTGRLGGIQFFFNVEAGTRTVSVGVSYYNNSTEPKKLLRQSGDPANAIGQGRFAVPGLGDEYIAQRGQLGSGEAAASVILIGWVRGPFFVSLADLGGTQDTPTDIAVTLARLIDARLTADPNP